MSSPHHLNIRLFVWSLTSALAGFLYGFDTVVISGGEQQIQALWHLTPGQHGFAMASALYGTVLGSLLGGWPADRFGRKRTLLGVGALYIVSSLGSALANNVYVFALTRVVGGIGIGIATVAVPLYIAEIASPQSRGRLAGLFQFNIVFGIVIAYVSNAALATMGDQAWRWMLGVAAFPSLLYTGLCLGLPESPRWLLSKLGDRKAGVAVLRLIQPQATSEQIEHEATAILAASAQEGPAGRFWTASLRGPILIAFFVALFNQLSGINPILYFAPRLFEKAGLANQAAFLQTIGIGITLLLFTMLGVWLLDRVGRRTLLYIGSYGYIVSLGLLSWAFFQHHYAIVPACLFVFIAAHAVGQGTVIWVLIAEIFPNRHRAEGQAFGGSTHWICAAVLTTVFPKIIDDLDPGYVFLFFCGMMVLQLLWVKTSVVETKGLTLEQISERFRIQKGRVGKALPK
jgi:MFS transporter, SP family, arabinose:H+ symporter